jgi:hypothetical protein
MITDKYKTGQREIKSSRDLYNECTRVLEAYEKMWKDCAIVSFNNGIQATIDEAVPIVSQYTSLSHSFGNARSRLFESNKLASDRGQQVDSISETLRVKVDSEAKTKLEMAGWRERVGVLEARVAE